MGSRTAGRRGVAWTVRTRIIAVITVASAIGMLSVGGVVYVVERARIIAQVDGRLDAGYESARFLVRDGATGDAPWTSSVDALESVVTRMSPDDNTGALGVIDGAAALVPGVPLDVDLQSAPGFVSHVAARGAERSVMGTYAEDGVTWRYLAAPIEIEGSPDPARVMFVLAYDLEAELAEIDGPAQVYLLAAAIAIALIAGAAGLAAARLLRPLRRMRETAERVSARSLAERLPVEGHDDVSELASTMNDMLDRLDDALESQRRLLSDVGHELKTPITIVSGNLEVMDVDDRDDVQSTRALAIDELARMGRLVQDLADEASLHGPAPIAVRPTDVSELVAQVARKAQGIEGATVTAGSAPRAIVELDSARITQALLQLAQNAVSHGGGELGIGARRVGDTIELSVRDHGPGVPDEAKERIFERFQRGDTEGRGADGSGLGLSIVQVIARAHGGSASARDAAGGGAEFVISLPSPHLSAVELTTAEPEAHPPRPPRARTVRIDDREVVVPPRPDLPSGPPVRTPGDRTEI